MKIQSFLVTVHKHVLLLYLYDLAQCDQHAWLRMFCVSCRRSLCDFDSSQHECIRKRAMRSRAYKNGIDYICNTVFHSLKHATMKKALWSNRDKVYTHMLLSCIIFIIRMSAVTNHLLNSCYIFFRKLWE